MKTSHTSLVIFGDLRGWDTRLTLRHHTQAGAETPLRQSGGYATVHVGPETVHGPIVHDTTTGGGDHLQIVYVGRRIPEWVQQPELAHYGWAPTDDLPDGIQFAFEELDILLLHFDDDGGLHGWTRTVWLPAAPRPMQRLSLQLGDGEGPKVAVKILEVGDDLMVDGGVTPFVIADTATPPRTETLTAYGWAEEPWAETRRDTWWGLHLLAQAVEAKTETVLGYSMTTEVTVHHPNVVEQSTLLLLPHDVRGALQAALDNPPND